MSEYVQLTVKINSIQMMANRGYNISSVFYPETSENRDDRRVIGMELGEFLDEFPEVSDFTAIYTHRETGMKTLVIFVAEDDGNIRIDVIREVLKQAGDLYTQQKKKSGLNRVGVILITNNQLGPKSKKVFDDTDLPNIPRERFVFGELMTNNSQIPDVPISEIVPEDEVDSLLRRLNCYNADGYHPEWLPKMMDTEPQARWNGYLPGQIIRIYRNDPSIGTLINGSIGYRLVISSAVVAKNRTVKVIGQEMKAVDDEEMGALGLGGEEFYFEE